MFRHQPLSGKAIFSDVLLTISLGFCFPEKHWRCTLNKLYTNVGDLFIFWFFSTKMRNFFKGVKYGFICYVLCIHINRQWYLDVFIFAKLYSQTSLDFPDFKYWCYISLFILGKVYFSKVIYYSKQFIFSSLYISFELQGSVAPTNEWCKVLH